MDRGRVGRRERRWRNIYEEISRELAREVTERVRVKWRKGLENLEGDAQ